jgi:uncharacterized HAD superfamily protein
MRKLTIGMDIDGVILDIGKVILPFVCEVCGREVTYQELDSWDLGKALNIDEQTMDKTWDRILQSDALRNAPAVKGAIHGLKVLREHQIWLITSRPVSSRKLTVNWLRKHRASYDRVIFNRRGNKVSVGPSFDVFVEDFFDEAASIAQAGVFTVVFDQPWNQTPKLPEKCVRAHDWNELLGFIDDLKG